MAETEKKTMPTHTRPASLGFACDQYHPSPHADETQPYLVQCPNRAGHRLVLRIAGGDLYTVKRCADCAETLRQKIADGGTFEIISDKKLR